MSRRSDMLVIGIKNAALYPLRMLLCTLTLSIGVGAVMCVWAISKTGEDAVREELWRMGISRIELSGSAFCSSDALSAEEIAGESAARHFSFPARFGGETDKRIITACESELESAAGIRLASGRFFTRLEQERGARVCIASDSSGFILGESAETMGMTLDIIGIFEASSARGTDVFVPLALFEGLSGILGITVNAGINADARGKAEDMKNALALKYGSGVTAQSAIRETAAAQEVLRVFSKVLIWVSAACILLGLVGIMSVMLLSVSQRRREIGLYIALGAGKASVMSIFLSEGCAYSAMGGLFGAVIGILLTKTAGWAIGISAKIPTRLFPIIILASSALGLLFSLLPALKACSLSPADALR
ncbi:MAG: ABC transporter permease [Eubacteriales bacterium]|nr:ABC transporter permease [Eubacteriales bacterium]MDD3882312.1 ABC transporter permease [Eubacteriales bacterium]MDD4512058.1 ABC transporter permease [Eubacteriales bacterium]